MRSAGSKTSSLVRVLLLFGKAVELSSGNGVEGGGLLCESVFMVGRHCVRRDFDGAMEKVGYENFTRYDDFSELEFPDWGVPDGRDCLPRGRRISKNFGARILNRVPEGDGKSPRFVKILFDEVSRDIDTASDYANAFRVAGGLELDVQGSRVLFDPLGRAEGCKKAKNLSELRRERWSRAGVPEDIDVYLDRLDEVMGRGAGTRKRLRELPVDVQLSVASRISQLFLFQLGGGIEPAWGRLKNLGDPSRHNGTLLVGHDGDIDRLAAALKFTWFPHPFSEGATPPNGALLFRVRGCSAETATVSLSFAFTTFEEEDAPLREVPVFFLSEALAPDGISKTRRLSKAEEVPVSGLLQRIREAGFAPACSIDIPDGREMGKKKSDTGGQGVEERDAEATDSEERFPLEVGLPNVKTTKTTETKESKELWQRSEVLLE
uniref:Uncharacterized protein n=1 Tax=Chromera velia CCMP2878 TaxID=1169474 RepID=A0A0G4HPZ2_9ALVE|eukprot:Cvel_29956.t1-p1 / transcript=Cvel_29956.t1 / gene=Cvel_29956 / organism=Chromera_velia_CCMP2878 / gene_product=hypothetical protein / transcript_product=hypothetical protein / location=Cvel_scaffold4195:5479-9446(+) / protein_length=434 / sequence_SO=supercontig / SO=protein_coding / is_pseudo=false